MQEFMQELLLLSENLTIPTGVVVGISPCWATTNDLHMQMVIWMQQGSYSRGNYD